MSDRLLQLEKNLRNAISGRRYTEVRLSAALFSAQASTEWNSFPADNPAARRIFSYWQDVMEWARLMMCTARACVTDDLRRARLTNRYLSRTGGPSGYVHLDI